MGFLDGASMIALGNSSSSTKEIHNKKHFSILLARVFSKVASKISVEREYDMSKDIYDIIIENNLLSLCAKRDKIADCDVVSIFEAVKWSILYIQKGLRTDIIPVCVQDSDDTNSIYAEDVNIYNAFVCDIGINKEIKEWVEYSYFDSNKPALHIVKWSETSYSPSLEEEDK